MNYNITDVVLLFKHFNILIVKQLKISSVSADKLRDKLGEALSKHVTPFVQPLLEAFDEPVGFQIGFFQLFKHSNTCWQLLSSSESLTYARIIRYRLRKRKVVKHVYNSRNEQKNFSVIPRIKLGIRRLLST